MMCGPATAPMTCAWTPRWPSASVSRRGGLLLAGGVGPHLLRGRALEDPRLGEGELLVGDRQLEVELLAPAGLRRGRRRGRPGRERRRGRDVQLGHRIGGGLLVQRLGLGLRPRRPGDRDLGRGAEEVRVAQHAVEGRARRARAHDRLLARRLGRPEERGLVRRRLGPVVGLVAAALAAQAAGRLGDAGVRGAQHARHRRAGQQQRRGHGQEDRDDARPDVGERARRRVVERPADDAAVLADGVAARAEQEEGRAEQADRARPERADRREHRAHHDQRPGRDQRHGDRVGDRAERPREAVDDRLAGGAAVPAQVQREREEHARGDEREAGEVEVAPLDDGQPRAPGRGRTAGAGLRRGAAALGGVLALRGGLGRCAGRGHQQITTHVRHRLRPTLPHSPTVSTRDRRQRARTREDLRPRPRRAPRARRRGHRRAGRASSSPSSGARGRASRRSCTSSARSTAPRPGRSRSPASASTAAPSASSPASAAARSASSSSSSTSSRS